MRGQGDSRGEHTEEKSRKGGHESQGQRDLHSGKGSGPQERGPAPGLAPRTPEGASGNTAHPTTSPQRQKWAAPDPHAEMGGIEIGGHRNRHLCCFCQKEYSSLKVKKVTKKTNEQFKLVQQNIS